MTLADYLETGGPERETRWCGWGNTLSPESVSVGSKKRGWWQCARGHRWQAAIHSVAVEGSGCPYCAGKLPIAGENDLATTHPALVPMWSVRNPLGPEQWMAGSHKKAWWRCEQGHEWEAVIASVALEGSGCPYCAGKLPIPGQTDLGTLRPDIAAQWDPERNGRLTPAQVMPSGHDKVWWRCEQGHRYQAVIFARTREKPSGCPYCAGRRVLAGFNDLATRKPKLAREWYQSLNGKLTPADVTLGSNKRVWWQCAEGHVWQAVIYSRTRKRSAGCPVCTGTVKQPKRIPARTTRTIRPTPTETTQSINA